MQFAISDIVFIECSDRTVQVTRRAQEFSDLYPITELSINGPLDQIDNDNQTIIIYQLLIEILLRSPLTEQSRKDLIDYVRKMYIQSDKNKEKDVEKFASSYISDRTIDWYTRPSFVRCILSSTCSTDNIHQIYKVRYFIHDLYNELKQLHSASLGMFDKILCIYHGKRMNIEELQKMDEHIGDVVITTTFLPTTMDRNVALFFAGEGTHTDGKVAVIFRIFIDTDSNKTKPFAFIGLKSLMKDELEVLISIETIFRILTVEKISEYTWEVTLFRDIKEQTFEQTIIDHNLTVNIDKQAKIINSMLEFLENARATQSADKYIQMVFNQLHSLSSIGTNNMDEANDNERSGFQMQSPKI